MLEIEYSYGDPFVALEGHFTSFQVKEETVPHTVKFWYDHQQSPGENHSNNWYLPP
jgi:hypothetical protein